MNLHRNFKLCTLCLSKDRNLLNVFDHNEGDSTVPGVIRELLQFEVVQGGRIPWNICSNCVIKLNDFQRFKTHATKCKEYLESTFLQGGRNLDSIFQDGLAVTMKTEDNNEGEMLSNESFTIEDGIIPKMEVTDDVPERTEESHPTQTDILKPVEVFVNVDAAVESGEMMEEEMDPLGDEEVDVEPSALIVRLDVRGSREEDGAPSSLPTGNALPFGGMKPKIGDGATETWARKIVESSAEQRSSSVTVVSYANVVGAAVDGIGKGVGGYQQTMEAENNFNALLATGHHSSARPQQGTIVPESAIFHWMKRRLSSDSQNNDKDGKEGTESFLHNTGGKFVERSESLTQINPGMRIESEDYSKTLIGEISNGPPTGDDESEVDYFQCDECGKVFRTKSLLRRHFLVHCEGKGLESGLQISQTSKYERHQSVQRGGGISKRKWQRRVAVDGKGESGGKGKIRNRILPTCRICRKEFSCNGNLTKHMQYVHRKEGNFLCKICGKEFSRKFNLQTHVRCHSGSKPYTCNHCRKGFSQAGSLRSHIKSVHSMEKSHICSVCGKAFSYKCRLKSHMLLHARESPHT